MADTPISFQVDPGKELQKAFDEARKVIKDFTIPFKFISNDWFKSNKAIFSLKSPGQYVDLTEKYKKVKQKKVGFVYPILKLSGLLAKSMTDASDLNSINLIINGNTLVLGTKVSYAAFHQFGSKHLPVRPVIFTDGSQSATDDKYNRSGAWAKIIQDYVFQVQEQILGGK